MYKDNESAPSNHPHPVGALCELEAMCTYIDLEPEDVDHGHEHLWVSAGSSHGRTHRQWLVRPGDKVSCDEIRRVRVLQYVSSIHCDQHSVLTAVSALHLHHFIVSSPYASPDPILMINHMHPTCIQMLRTSIKRADEREVECRHQSPPSPPIATVQH